MSATHKATRQQLAAIHIAKKDRAMDDDTYRDFLERQAGVRSAADLDEAGAARVLAAFAGIGFKPPSKDARTSNDKRPIVKKARAMWVALYNLDEVPDRTDRALDRFARSITGKETLRFATNGEVAKVIEGLKAWMRRIGIGGDLGGADALYDVMLAQHRRLADRGIFTFGAQVDLSHTFSRREQHHLSNAMGTEIRRLKLGARRKSPSQQQGAANAQQDQGGADLG
jgi:phage gp16-like protein